MTLACADGKQVEAHKVILAASSPFFQNLLGKNKHAHPIVFLTGLKSEELVAILDFIYYGETNVYKDNLDAFLAIAEEFQLKGLTRGKLIEEEILMKENQKQRVNVHPIQEQYRPKQNGSNGHKSDNAEEIPDNFSGDLKEFEGLKGKLNYEEKGDENQAGQVANEK